MDIELALISMLVLVAVLVAVRVLHNCALKDVGTRNPQCIEGALASLDCVVGGKRVIGLDAKVIARRHSDNLTTLHQINVVELCKTTKGQLFEHRFEVFQGKVLNQRVELLSEDQAKAWFGGDSVALERAFGQIELA